MSERRYQIFISSTFLDLKEERSKVLEAVLGMEAFPVGMELFPASNESQWELIKGVIDDSDYYVLILGGRYGSTDQDGLSYTEKEYRYAIDTKTPVLGFVRADPENVPLKFSETDPTKTKQLDEFRDLVMSRMCKQYTNADQLAGQVITSLTSAIRKTPAVGWVRGSEAMTPEIREELLILKEALQKAEEKERHSEQRDVDPDLHQGGDHFTIEYKTARGGRYGGSGTPDKRDFSWNEIYRVVAPLMLDESSEAHLSQALEQMIRAVDERTITNDHLHVHLDSDSFQQVKVQLLALGYIERSSRQRSVKDSSTYWSLTALGEDTMMALRAIRKTSQ